MFFFIHSLEGRILAVCFVFYIHDVTFVGISCCCQELFLVAQVVIVEGFEVIDYWFVI